LQLKVKKLKLWSPGNPYLYKVVLRTGEDMVEDQVGFRSIKTRGQDILLNDQPIFLKGISIHEENAMRGGRAYSKEDARMLLNWAKELGCNFVRLAHYPHSEHMIRLADEMGIMVWEENPVYWTILWDNEETYKTAETQLNEVISRDKNRASVIIWSMGNETPASEQRTAFIRNLIENTRSLDPTRLISAALEAHGGEGDPNIRVLDDPLIEYVDLMSFNQYVGWYDGLPEKARLINWEIVQDKSVVISEFGAGALQGHHGDSLTRWTEEYQESVYRETLDMLQRIPQLRGISPWILVDFRSPRRVLPGIQDGWNRKGLISETGDKKKAFYVLRNFYQAKAPKDSF
jgi:beta-glucuronidase